MDNMIEQVHENESIKIIEDYFTMPDGVKLYTRIITPKGKDKFPVVFIRTPYAEPVTVKPCDINEYTKNLFIQNGYAIVLQHCRGRGSSEGICTPYAERDDGLRTLEIIRALPFYCGEIYIHGGSYLSTVHLSYLNTNPEDIKGASLNIQADRMYLRNYRNGCCYDWCNLKWWLRMIKKQYPEQNIDNAIIRPYKDIMKRVIGEDYPHYTEYLMNDTCNEFWTSDPRTSSMDNLKIPTLLTEGWYDSYVMGMYDMWERIPGETKKKSAMVIGPWGHTTQINERTKLKMENHAIPDDYAVEWFNSIRENRPYKYAKTGCITYHSIGGDKWETDLAVSGGIDRFYFGKRRDLSPTPTDRESGITYRYDPDERLECFKYNNIYKAHQVGDVKGVLSFKTKAFTEDTDYYGKIRWKMTVATDCNDTAFFIRVYLVRNFTGYNLTETITSLSHINPDYKAGEKITIDIKTPPIGFTVCEGDAIRVDIASDGGIYVPHANVKGHWAEVTESRVANNTIYIKDAFIEIPKK